jgi:UDP-N-acetyl-D-galactosamine dehydrogenase
MTVYNDLIDKKSKIVIVGLGYVGLPLAVSFARKVNVIGFDLDVRKIDKYKAGIDCTNEVGSSLLVESNIEFTTDEKSITEGSFIIIAVPTPIYSNHEPDLSAIKSASQIVGRNLKKGSIVVYESTVYPGCTEDVCIPILEKESGLRCGTEFKVGYSPERINPGDKKHKLEDIVKIVSGMDEESLAEVKKVYEMIINAGTYVVSNIKTAEAVKIAENSQRDINIAFMNELAMVFNQMGIDTNEVVDGMNTKWNALGFRPGLVGGHCIGVDPYYFTFEAERLGYHSPLILNGRKINEEMGTYIADKAIECMIQNGINPQEAKVAVLGVTFKENCGDIRNSKVIDVINRLKENGIHVVITDPEVNNETALLEYGISLSDMAEIKEMDCVIVAVAHDCFKKMTVQAVMQLFNPEKRVLIDVKGIFPIKEIREAGVILWRL